MKYRKKPVVIEARQLTAVSRDGIKSWIGNKAWFYESNGDAEMYIETLEGTMTAVENDWIIKGIKGDFYPCKQDIFEATYEKVE